MLIYADRGMDKVRTAVNVRYNEQIALRQQLVSQIYTKFTINLFRFQKFGSHRKWRPKYGSPLSLFNWIFLFQRINDLIPLTAARNKCTGFSDVCWWRDCHLGSHTTWDRHRRFGRTYASIFRVTVLHLLRGLLRRKSVDLKKEAALSFGKLLTCFTTSYVIWGLLDRASSSWNNAKCQLDVASWFYWCILSLTCFGYIRPSSRALDVELQHMVFCAEFVDGWWSWEPLRRSCVRCGWCRATRKAPSAPYTRPTQRMSGPPPIQKLGAENHLLNSTSNAPDDGLLYPKHVELRIHQQNHLIASSWHFTLFLT